MIRAVSLLRSSGGFAHYQLIQLPVSNWESFDPDDLEAGGQGICLALLRIRDRSLALAPVLVYVDTDNEQQCSRLELLTGGTEELDLVCELVLDMT
jgi:hypothetical protein